MMELTATNLRYLLTVRSLSRTQKDISSMSIALALHVSKPSVVRVLENLQQRGLVVKARYGKVYLTDRGAFTADFYQRYIGQILAAFPPVGLALDQQEKYTAALAMAAALPSRAYRQAYAALFADATEQEGEEEKEEEREEGEEEAE